MKMLPVGSGSACDDSEPLAEEKCCMPCPSAAGSDCTGDNGVVSKPGVTSYYGSITISMVNAYNFTQSAVARNALMASLDNKIGCQNSEITATLYIVNGGNGIKINIRLESNYAAVIGYRSAFESLTPAALETAIYAITG